MDIKNISLDNAVDNELKRYTSADIVYNICKIAKTKDYVTAFSEVKSKHKNIILSNATEVLF